MGMGMSSMSSGVREHVQKEITDLKTMINNEITGLKTEINNDNAEIYAGLLKAVNDKIATINENMSIYATLPMINAVNDAIKPLREELMKLQDRHSNLQQTEITDKESLSKLNIHMNEIERKFKDHVTHTDVKDLEERMAKLEAIIAPTREMSPATLGKVSKKEDFPERSPNSADLIRNIRGAKEIRRNSRPGKNRRESFLDTLTESQANKNPYLLFLE